MKQDILTTRLNAPGRADRLEAIRGLKDLIDSGGIPDVPATSDVNNHVHTTYSFSPYSPAMAVWRGYQAGLKVVGIVDHDSVSGAKEFLEAAEIIGIIPTVGLECRVDMSRTVLGERRINNPDQGGVAYMTMHGIPHTSIDLIDRFLVPLRERRGVRNRKMVLKINGLFNPFGVAIDYDADVLPLSMSHDGGSVTERHILYALSRALIASLGKGGELVAFLRDKTGVAVSEKTAGLLLDADNPYYEYDLLGLLKSSLIEQIYIPATDECPPASDYIALAKEAGTISAYAYLGDVGESVTGDKKAQTFEDAYLPELFDLLSGLGVNGISYMPSRNTPAQITRLRELIAEHQLFQISGEDINQPRQRFVCEAQRAPEFADLYDSTLAMVGSERKASIDLSDSMFSEKTIAAYPSLSERIAVYKEYGLNYQVRRSGSC
ncbi:MAG: PHP domain-containing protein [Clostridiales Family XIII bacterium]|jgi:hypothetical protein|nr:PHP domain-containing protein [Clostridiales Family XIII bacterium]